MLKVSYALAGEGEQNSILDECINFKFDWVHESNACWDWEVLPKSWPCGAGNASFWSLRLKCRPEPCSGSGTSRRSSGGIQASLAAARSCGIPSQCRSHTQTDQNTNYVHGSQVWEPTKQKQTISMFSLKYLNIYFIITIITIILLHYFTIMLHRVFLSFHYIY